jgi:hypothetical protein
VTLYWLALAFKVIAAALAVWIGRGRSEYRAVAGLIGGTTIVDVVRLALQARVIGPASGQMVAAGINPVEVPFTGWVRFASDVDRVLFLTWPAGLAALCLWVYGKRRPWPIVVVYALAAAAVVIGYPTLRYDALRRFYLGAELAALAVGVVAFVRWVRSEPPRLAHVATSFVLVIDIGVLVFGPWRWGLFGAWNLAQIMYAVLYAALIVLQLGALWIPPSPSSPR